MFMQQEPLQTRDMRTPCPLLMRHLRTRRVRMYGRPRDTGELCIVNPMTLKVRSLCCLEAEATAGTRGEVNVFEDVKRQLDAMTRCLVRHAGRMAGRQYILRQLADTVSLYCRCWGPVNAGPQRARNAWTRATR